MLWVDLECFLCKCLVRDERLFSYERERPVIAWNGSSNDHKSINKPQI